MNGVHDMGGMHGLGPIKTESDDVVFHEEWEGRTLALARALLAGMHFNLDEFRHAMERIEPSYYLTSSYYERWLEGSITLLLEKGVVSQAEFDARLADLRGETS
ncbi:MAG: nitrile hydratase subunit beta [Alphaproteobacteria bacterium]|jgi:nitrile hydratase|nr:nitrile hydratase subunit beta [Alphaproteobacteria bacterium]MDP6829783.1 nitrile hydratase subunit beta [Alphaproteobacteria bacterium]MDP6872517.1 nitrile hydratase subunit beta [Alphaproteobacteria bacterium]